MFTARHVEHYAAGLVLDDCGLGAIGSGKAECLYMAPLEAAGLTIADSAASSVHKWNVNVLGVLLAASAIEFHESE